MGPEVVEGDEKLSISDEGTAVACNNLSSDDAVVPQNVGVPKRKRADTCDDNGIEGILNELIQESVQSGQERDESQSSQAQSTSDEDDFGAYLSEDEVAAALIREGVLLHAEDEDATTTTAQNAEGDHSLKAKATGRAQKFDVTAPKQGVLSPNDAAMIDVIRYCNANGTTVKFLDGLRSLLKKHKLSSDFNLADAPSRKVFMSRLAKVIHSPDVEISVTDGGDSVPKFSFVEMVIDLLQSPLCQNRENCCLNFEGMDKGDYDPKKVFGKYIPTESEMSSTEEIMFGEWYRRTHDEMMERLGGLTYIDPDTGEVYINFLVALLGYNDRTGHGAILGSYSLEPLMMTLAFLRTRVREMAEAWRHLGFFPTCNGLSPEENLNRHHECMRAMLYGLKEAQESPPLVKIEMFGKKVNLRLVFEVAYIIGDQPSQDHHCGRKKVNGGGAGRAHRMCTCSYLSADDAFHVCEAVDKSVIDKLSNIVHQGEDDEMRQALLRKAHRDDSLPRPTKTDLKVTEDFLRTRAALARSLIEKVYSLYPIRNAWGDISFGANPYGIHRATLDDPMHFNSQGMMMYLLKVAFDILQPRERAAVETILRKDSKYRCSVTENYPRGKFSHGFTSCSLLQADHKVGVVHALYLALGREDMANVYRDAIKRQQEKYLRTANEATADDEGRGQTAKSYDQFFFADVRQHAAEIKRLSKNRDKKKRKEKRQRMEERRRNALPVARKKSTSTKKSGKRAERERAERDWLDSSSDEDIETSAEEAEDEESSFAHMPNSTREFQEGEERAQRLLIERTSDGIAHVVQALAVYGLTFICGETGEQVFDELQTEYIFQAVWQTVLSSGKLEKQDSSPYANAVSQLVKGDEMYELLTMIEKNLNKSLRRSRTIPVTFGDEYLPGGKYYCPGANKKSSHDGKASLQR